ncbi:hypothetical protein LTR91_002161 [Friedmanniomyces endolithicus]|uniref:EamA domain-containing protein n=1 Tax=Friedmanniomyces endolithicus TaxID=329885 RepID=A0A4U0VIU2_9PEZI|nr:hypothetical protein LTS09_004719 [Friedmanniomyces endolithicus]KAK0298176.1 hypothetical protein LTS00_003141 [Friedmanniomyces endolithicus]KAK0313598.1 hypothetical protein LTR01_001855 [Friedmanniomyces endolithicus]KAK0830388.1 hypothetical protein LTR73_003667 [Friedmanniomyces endolithicus]KAK0975667.1 hypothetical protein LTS01_013761 [Friedmanniomyces endolithicus]
MTLPDPDAHQADKADQSSTYELEEYSRHDSPAVTPKPESEDYRKPGIYSSGNNNGSLSAPLSGPIRPLSPDTISNLSIEEYEQLQPRRSRTNDELQHAGLKRPLRGWRAKLRAFYIHNLGLGYMLIAQVFGTMMNVTTRLLEVEGNKGRGMHPFQILFARMGITLVLASGYMWWKRTPDFPLGKREVRWLLAARGFGGFFGVFGMYYSLLYLPLADATVITFLAPGITCWMCSFLINEPFGRIEQIACVVSLVGVALIAKPSTLFAVLSSHSSDSDGAPIPTNGTLADGVGGGDASNYDAVTPTQRLLAVGVALVGVMGAVTAYTTIRWIGKRAHPLISVNYFAAWCTLVSTVMMLSLPDVGFLLPAELKEWGYLFFLGTCGFIMQFLLAAGLSYEKSSRATNITYTQMLFALSFDKFFFGHTPDLLSIAGSTLILGSAIYIALMANAGKNGPAKEVGEGGSASAGLGTEGELEAHEGLLGGARMGERDVESGEDYDRLDVREVAVRALR